MWNDRLRASVAKAVYDTWNEQGQPEIIEADDVLSYYRRNIGDITQKVLGEVLALMEDDPGPMPFLRVRLEGMKEEMGDLALAKINPERLRVLAAGESLSS